MQPGTLVADRFEIERRAGSGGMATVYRARDRLQGGFVALKVMGTDDVAEVDRFTREATVLAELDHPAIVQYVAHGRTAEGRCFLAMEWLEGETLSERLRRAGLRLKESVALAARAADALASAQARGIVHRDVKPSNLFLPGGDVAGLKILDFGIARLAHGTHDRTRTGTMLGTPGYMAPEQARGDKNVGPEADVFSLGCVLFECLTGKQAFSGDHPMAVLAKILLADAPRVRDLQPDAPLALDELVARMLAKAPEARPRDGGEVARLLSELDLADEGSSLAPRSVQPPSLTTGEQRLMCVALAGPTAKAADDPPASEPPTLELGPKKRRADDPRTAALRSQLAPFGGRTDTLAGGSLMWSLLGRGVATDQAALAARAALAMRHALPDASLALATGRGVVATNAGDEPWSGGEVIDRAARILAACPRGVLLLDAMTAGLLDTSFDVAPRDGGDEVFTLRGLRSGSGEPARTLLGKLTPCVGREAELGSLMAMFEHCVAEEVAVGVLVTSAVGIGKSRVRYEFLRRVQARGEPLEILMGRGDPMKVGSPFGLLAPALRRAAGILDGEPSAVQREKLAARVARSVGAEEASRVAAFLGEVAHVERAGDDDSQVRAALRDPMLMGDQMSRAWEAWLSAECDAQPVILVLEDLHLGDLPTVKFVDHALRNLKNKRLMLLALARPEVHEVFPRLWAERRVTEIKLRELGPRACERLVRQVLGTRASDATVERVVAQSEGNAFYLEELIRAVSEDEGTPDDRSELPGTVLAMVQARLERLDPEARRVLRAASVFGQVFWSGGLAALLGGANRTEGIGAWLDHLVEREVVTRRVASRFPNEQELTFRHALVRQAAYAMLTPEDQALGHKLAAQYLESVGEREATILAEHFDRAGETEPAGRWYKRAAEQALEGNDFDRALSSSRRAIDCGARGETLGALLLLQAEVHTWKGARAETQRTGRLALGHIRRGTPLWHAALAVTLAASARLGAFDAVVAYASEVPALDPEAEPDAAEVMTLARVAPELLQIGRAELAAPMLRSLERLHAAGRVKDAAVTAWVETALAWEALFAGDTSKSLLFDEASARSFERAGDIRNACKARAGAGYERMLLGAYAEAETALRDALGAAQRMGLTALEAMAKHNLGLVLARRGAFAEAWEVERQALDAYAAQGDSKLGASSRYYLALIELAADNPLAAEQNAALAVDALAAFPPLLPRGLACLALAKLRRGAAEEAKALACRAHALLEAQGGIEDGESMIRLVYAEAHEQTGDRETARAAISEARAWLLRVANRISDARLRESFTTHVPENARILALAKEWLGEDARQ